MYQNTIQTKKKYLPVFFASLLTASMFPLSVSAANTSPTPDNQQNKAGNLLSDNNHLVKVFMTSTEKSGDPVWYKQAQPMANQLTPKDAITVTALDNQSVTTLNIQPDAKQQSILGIGTSLEESTINNLAQLQPEVRRQFLKNLLDPVHGAGMTLFRLTIGTSDFTGQKFYTYFDHAPTDKQHPDWQNSTGKGFSIHKDEQYKIIETVKELQEIAKEVGVADNIKFFASSWTPPGWMKTATPESSKYQDNALGLKGGKLNDQHIDDLATYLVRYVEEYSKLGIPLYAVTLQNEPLLEINYPSTLISGQQEALVVKSLKRQLAGSAVLAKAGLAPKIWAFDHNFDLAADYLKDIYSVKDVAGQIDGIAFHPYSGQPSAMLQAWEQYRKINPALTVNLTERSVWGTKGADEIIQYFRNGASSYNAWVTMLDSNIAPHQWVGTPDPTMFSRQAGSDKQYWPMPEFFITGNFARFVRPGAVRVDSDYGAADKVTNVVFYSPQSHELTAVVVNQTDAPQTFKMVASGSQFVATLPAKNVATYIWQPLVSQKAAQ